MSVELNIDGIVGPTHHYGGLGLGNLASARHAASVSNPRQAALQGIAKLRALARLGIPQAVLPPHERPHVPTLRALGFTGSDAQVVGDAGRQAPGLLSALSSASAMWAANAATVSPSADTDDGRIHVTPANLANQLHRSIETATTTRLLRTILSEPTFVVHDPLPATAALGDEGAANTGRLATAHGEPGVELFVYGDDAGRRPVRHRPRQARLASEAIVRLHGLDPDRVVVAQQAADAIDSGVFHNDVIAVADRDVFLYHQDAYESPSAIDDIRRAADSAGVDLTEVAIPREVMGVDEAVASYLFNSQLVGLPDGRRVLVAPAEVEQVPAAAEALALVRESAVDDVLIFDLRQSMQNGGGPACLRLRVPMAGGELDAVHPGVLVDETLAGRLEGWVKAHYRDELRPRDLADPALLEESRVALDELTTLLRLGPSYEFQGVQP